jgi:hypothetical protein
MASRHNWGTGILEQWVPGKLDSGLLAKLILTERLTNEKLLFENQYSNIPPFHYSKCKERTQA